jgi:hypothetical protein
MEQGQRRKECISIAAELGQRAQLTRGRSAWGTRCMGHGASVPAGCCRGRFRWAGFGRRWARVARCCPPSRGLRRPCPCGAARVGLLAPGGPGRSAARPLGGAGGGGGRRGVARAQLRHAVDPAVAGSGGLPRPQLLPVLAREPLDVLLLHLDGPHY